MREDHATSALDGERDTQDTPSKDLEPCGTTHGSCSGGLNQYDRNPLAEIW